MKGYVLRRLAPDLPTIVRLYTEGASFEEVAARFECAPSTIRRLLISEGFDLRPALRKRKLDPVEEEVLEAFRAGAEINDLAARFGVSSETVVRFLLDRGTAQIRARQCHDRQSWGDD